MTVNRNPNRISKAILIVVALVGIFIVSPMVVNKPLSDINIPDTTQCPVRIADGLQMPVKHLNHNQTIDYYDSISCHVDTDKYSVGK